MTSSPGRKCRWYVFPRITPAPSTRTSSGWSVLTVAFVPTGMNAGVGIAPCAVSRSPARAAPSVALTVNALTVRCAHCRGGYRKERRTLGATPRLHPLRAYRESAHAWETGSCRISANTRSPSQQEHRVAEGVEAVPLGDRDPIELARLLHSGERHDEREQRRAREVEVRQQRIDPTELEARRDEEG